MGTIHNDKTLFNLMQRANLEFNYDRFRALHLPRGCARPDCLQVSGHPSHDDKRADRHAYLDPADEPIFVLRAQDMTAANVVAYWLAHQGNNLPREKYDEAQRLIEEMRAWPRKKPAD
jgi:hypothetical protein